MHFSFSLCLSNNPPGNGLINEAEFLQWVGRIQALRDEQSQQQQQEQQQENASKPDDLDDVTEDLIAAFRYVHTTITNNNMKTIIKTNGLQ